MDTLTRWSFPTGATACLDNGLRLRSVDMPGKQVATVTLSLALPTAWESPAREGAIAAWASLALVDAPFAQAGALSPLARMGASVVSGCDHRGPKIIADCRGRDVGMLLAAVVPALFGYQPGPRSFAAHRARRRAELEFEQRDPFALANMLLNASVLAPTSRYARSVAGTCGSWASMGVGDIDAVTAAIDPSLVTVVIVGDLATVDLAAVTEVLSAPPSRRPASTADLGPEPGGPARFEVRDGRPGAPCQLLLGSFAIDRLDPRWPSARLLAELLGGVDGLLAAELRARRGLTYGVEARFLPYVSGGLFTVSTKVDEARSEEALSTTLDIISRVSGHLDPRSVRTVRDRMVRQAPQTYESTLAVAQQHTELASCGMDPAFIDEHLTLLRDLDPDRVAEDAASLLIREDLHVVVVGRFGH